MSAVDAALVYLSQGWQPLPIPPGEKAPTISDWPNFRTRADEDPARCFTKDCNVGVLLGQASGGLVDVDLDCPEARVLAPDLLPPSGAIFGRPGSPSSHRIYIADGVKTKRYQDTNGGCLVEIRSDGAQTIFPPSTHPSGERIAWVNGGEPAEASNEQLAAAVGELAAASLLTRHWPAEGSRQDVALALGGMLLRGGWDETRAATFILVVARAAGDEEAGKRAETVRYSAQRLGTDQTATGMPSLVSLLGDEVADRVWTWLRLRGHRRPPVEADDGRPTLIIEGGDLPELVDQAEEALLADKADPIFQRGELLVRPVRAPAMTVRDLGLNVAGPLALCLVDQDYLVEKLTRLVLK